MSRENADGQEYRKEELHQGLEGQEPRATRVKRDSRHHLTPMRTSLGLISMPAMTTLRRRMACHLHQIQHLETLHLAHDDVAEDLISKNVSHDKTSPGW